MLLKPLAFAAAVAAYLIIPEISEKDESIVKALPIPADAFQLPVEALSQTIDVPCQQCKGKDAHFNLNFTIEDGLRLVANGFELYPNASPWHGDLTAEVVRTDKKAKEYTLGYSLSVVPKAKDEGQQLELVDVLLHVIEVGHRFVDAVPLVKVGLVKMATGEIVIVDMQLQGINRVPCKDIWCRTKSTFSDVVKGIKGIGGCHMRKQKGHHGHGAFGAKHHHSGPNAKHPMGSHHHHKKPHPDFRPLMRDIAIHVVLPVLMGIAAGVGLAFLTMFVYREVCRASVFVRGGCRRRSWRCRHKKNTTQHVATEEEKKGLMEVEEAQDTIPAPPYQDAV